MRYDKLVRDRIPEYIVSKGGVPVTHVADEAEYAAKLKEKLLEEVNEFLESESMEEIADIQEVIEAICVFKGFDGAEIAAVKTKKAEERGRFAVRIILEES